MMSFAITIGDRTALASPAATATQEHRRLTEAAQQFEGILLQELLKPMREHGSGMDEDSAAEGDSGGNTMTNFGTEVMAAAISKAGGVGIAKRVVAEVERERDLLPEGN